MVPHELWQMTASHSQFEIVEWQLYNGTLNSEQAALFAQMKAVVDDMRRPEEPIFYTWFEHCQWKWKQREYAWILEQLGPNLAGRKVMDAGCGYTPLIRHLAAQGCEAHGFDWDAIEAESNMEKSAALLHGKLVKYSKQDIRAMQWPSDYFDATVCVSVLEHLWSAQGFFQKAFDKFFPARYKEFHNRNVRRAIDEMVRVTRPGGLIIITLDCGYGYAIPVPVIEKLMGIEIKGFPSVETLRSYWERDEYYTGKNTAIPGHPRDYTAFMITLRKKHAHTT
jgi:SAM-dependent methyltransferase